MSTLSTRQLALQCGAVLAILALAWLLKALGFGSLSWGLLALAIGACAATLAWLTNQPPWWRFIHGGFMPLVWGANSLEIPPGWFLAGFILLFLVYRGAITGRVPLYLSNARTAARLAELVRERQAQSVVDIGAGIGSVVSPLAKALPGTQVAGVENAPLTWLIGRLMTLLRRRQKPPIDWRYGSLWDLDLGAYDVVYAFLSPEPMPALWHKASDEMASGTLLISNSFPVPGLSPTSVVEVDDRRQTILYCYTISKPA